MIPARSTSSTATSTTRLPHASAILTDGVQYQFFSDLDKPNIMDDKPFMIFNFDKLEEALIPELKKLANDSFDVDVALSAAQDLKHLRQIKQLIAQELASPSDTFVKHFVAQIYDGQLRASVLDDFRPKVSLAFDHYINDILLSRIQGIAARIPMPVYWTNPPSPQRDRQKKPWRTNPAS